MQTHSDRGAVRSTNISEARDRSRAQQPGPVVSAEKITGKGSQEDLIILERDQGNFYIKTLRTS